MSSGASAPKPQSVATGYLCGAQRTLIVPIICRKARHSRTAETPYKQFIAEHRSTCHIFLIRRSDVWMDGWMDVWTNVYI